MSLGRRVRRAVHDMSLRSPLTRWRIGGEPGDRLLIVPQALRTVDPSFTTELQAGTLGLAGAAVPYAGGSPFALKAPQPAWHDALHGFGWLRHLRAAETPEARQIAEDWVSEWLKKYRRQTGVGWSPEIAARRLISLLCGAGFVLNGSDARFHDAYVATANTHLRYLTLAYATEPEGMRRLFILTAIMYGGLCIADQESLLADYEPAFSDELKRQILPDGSSVSRETTSIVEIILDLLPLDRCFTAREMPTPEQLTHALQRALRFIDHMRLGDGLLARFNGVGPTWPDRVATVLAYRDVQNPPIIEARYSGYARLKRGAVIILMDVGVPPPHDTSIRAHAGCLSFEMSSGTAPVIVNCGAPGPADADWGPLARGTAAHSTLVLNDASSSVLMREPEEEVRLGGIPIEGPERVERIVRDDADGGMTVSAWHDGYLSRFGMRHERIIQTSANGHVVEGTDKLSGGGRMFAGRGKEVQSYAVRFHLHPRSRVRRGAEAGIVEIRLANEETWEFSTADGEVNLEESVFLAELSGPLQSVQLVLRGQLTNEAVLTWRLRKLGVPDEPTAATNPTSNRENIRHSLRVVDGDAGNVELANEEKMVVENEAGARSSDPDHPSEGSRDQDSESPS